MRANQHSFCVWMCLLPNEKHMVERKILFSFIQALSSLYLAWRPLLLFSVYIMYKLKKVEGYHNLGLTDWVHDDVFICLITFATI